MSATIAPACTLRTDAEAVNDDDAWDFAQALVEFARLEGRPVIVVLAPNGVATVEILMRPEQLERVIEREPLSLVGVYTGEAKAEDVHDDLRAMPSRQERAP